MATLAVQADTVIFREGGGSGITNATFDDTYIVSSSAYDNYGSANPLYARNLNGNEAVILLSIKELFSLLPNHDGGGHAIVIDGASLTFTNDTATSFVPTDVTFYRVTSDWVTEAPGASQDDTNWARRDATAPLTWAAGSFSSADYASANAVQYTWPIGANLQHSIDIAPIIEASYAAGGTGPWYGIALRLTYVETDLNHAIRPYSLEDGTASNRPTLEIDYHYTPEPATCLLTVTAGLGLVARRRRLA